MCSVGMPCECNGSEDPVTSEVLIEERDITRH
jgi:hypothetical protein